MKINVKTIGNGCTMSLKILVCCLCFFGQRTEAQIREPFQLGYRYTPLNDGDGNVQQLQMKSMFPIYQGERSVLAAGIAYLQQNVHSDTLELPEHLYALGIPLVWRYRLNTGTDLQVMGNISVNSEFNGISSEDIVYALAGTVLKKYSERLTLGYGIGYVRQFFGNQVVPVLHMDYEPNARWKIYGRFPIQAVAEFTPHDKNSFGLEWILNAISFRLDEIDGGEEGYVKNRNAGLMLFYRRKLFGHLTAKLSVGYRNTLYEQFYKDDNTWTLITFPVGEEPTPVREFKNSGGSFQVGLSYDLF
ncbi:DUF6268 family outer membrane beta-barrel protein [Sinomicrobium sp. M5D2P17]